MRVLVRILASLLGLVLAALGVTLAIEVGWQWAFPDKQYLLVPWKQWRTELTGLHWSSTPVQLTAGAAVVAGLLLLIFALCARRREVRMHEPVPDVSVSTSPRSLARVVGQRVRAAEGVNQATVVATGKSVRVRAVTRSQAESELRPKVVDAARDAVESFPLPRKPRISVVVSSIKDTSS